MFKTVSAKWAVSPPSPSPSVVEMYRENAGDDSKIMEECFEKFWGNYSKDNLTWYKLRLLSNNPKPTYGLDLLQSASMDVSLGTGVGVSGHLSYIGLQQQTLTCHGPLMIYGVRELGHHWYSQWLISVWHPITCIKDELLTHWGWVMHICVSKFTIIGSVN